MQRIGEQQATVLVRRAAISLLTLGLLASVDRSFAEEAQKADRAAPAARHFAQMAQDLPGSKSAAKKSKETISERDGAPASRSGEIGLQPTRDWPRPGGSPCVSPTEPWPCK